jgi:adenine-specific DNA-methyltransferase
MEAAVRKRHGVHYTPRKLARFLAEQTVLQWESVQDQPVHILDPACGDGELLLALIDALPCPASQICVTGFDQDRQAAEKARGRLGELGLYECEVQVVDFLKKVVTGRVSDSFDMVIANPPYVRTQVLGGIQAQNLAKQFGLTGRVDLYHAFAIAISNVLGEGGVLGLLTSNRFLTVKSGLALRQRLSSDFELRQIFDLGDTRLFDAAVLPVVLTAVKRQGPNGQSAGFHRVYQASEATDSGVHCSSIIQAMSDPVVEGLVESDQGRFLIERGQLSTVGDDAIWTLSNQQTHQWLEQVRNCQATTFGELAEIKVGIKTTADRIFVREDWDELPVERRPESGLLRPLITHHDAERWSISTAPQKTVFYPYLSDSERRQPIALRDFPQGAAYLKSNRRQLVKRKYLIDSGRKWYEIWVPQQPQDWAKPKIVWPDISQQPKFFLDSSGAIVNGDCYWSKLRAGVDPDWIYLMLAVANSSVATTFYDIVFHNMLYAGRRRFMTQYVKDFPLPEIKTPIGKKIVRSVKQLIVKSTPAREQKIEQLVRESFGF